MFYEMVLHPHESYCDSLYFPSRIKSHTDNLFHENFLDEPVKDEELLEKADHLARRSVASKLIAC